ncbi:MAG TPA: DUF4172 domain-containing protein [Phycisphaerales bacterium]|nr:DUF4172 domain-containing protein [Phycisphaerales bacterium]|tara:strand:- start:416 stop:1543 length:1128 start_codon:yes stop_codon:yes gene_type:complete
MIWNWEQPDWPNFTFDASALEGFEAEFLHRAGVLLGALKHIDDDDRQQLAVDILSEEAIKTSEIEGEILDRDSVQSSIRRQFGLAADDLKVRPAERGVAEMMVELYNHIDGPLKTKRLFTWHRMLMQGHRWIDSVGGYRKHAEPMQVVSGRVDQPNVHFEAPPSADVPKEMDGFLKWFNDTAPVPGKSQALHPVIRAGIAHLYFVSIHPFEDGNGRIARAISELALSQALKRPTLIALSRTIEQNKNAYYDQLEHSNKANEITGWLTYFGQTILNAQAETHRFIVFLIEKAKLFDRVRDQINERQSKCLLRLFKAGPDGFVGGLSAQNYISITRASKSTATRDLTELVEMGVLDKSGERRHTRYRLNIKLPADFT